jgi:plastocyanin
MPDPSATHGLRPRATLAALAPFVLVLAACSSSSEPPASQAAPSQAATSQAPASQAPASEAPASEAPTGTTVTLKGLAFSVAEITVPIGPLTFVNEDAVPHLLAEGENGVEVASPRVQKVSINPNSQGDLVFTVAGDYNITCTIHKTMNMVVHVQ